MKFLKMVLIISLFSIAPLNANNNQAVGSGIAAGIAVLALMRTNSPTECKTINYKNYVVGKKMFTSPATAIIDDKFDACVSKVVVFDGNIEDTDSYKLNIVHGKEVNARKQDNGYEINIATSIVAPMDKLSKGKIEEDIFINIDENGLVVKAKNPFKNMINKKLFTITDKIVLQDKTSSREIIYTGISGNELHLQYREYKGNTIKWPFTMNLVFDIKKSNIIKIKNYKIEIIEANNSEIVYKIL